MQNINEKYGAIIGKKMSSACWTWAGIHVLLESNTICCRGVRNNHLKFIQLITNWQAEGRLAWRLFRPLATRSRDLCGLHSERQSGVISNFSNNLILFKYSNTYLHFQSPRRSSALVKLHCEHLVDFFPRHYEGEVKAEKFQI